MITASLVFVPAANDVRPLHLLLHALRDPTRIHQRSAQRARALRRSTLALHAGGVLIHKCLNLCFFFLTNA